MSSRNAIIPSLSGYLKTHDPYPVIRRLPQIAQPPHVLQIGGVAACLVVRTALLLSVFSVSNLKPHSPGTVLSLNVRLACSTGQPVYCQTIALEFHWHINTKIDMIYGYRLISQAPDRPTQKQPFRPPEDTAASRKSRSRPMPCRLRAYLFRNQGKAAEEIIRGQIQIAHLHGRHCLSCPSNGAPRLGLAF